MKPAHRIWMLVALLVMMGAGYRVIGIAFLPVGKLEGVDYPFNPYISTAETAKDIWTRGTWQRPHFAVLHGHLMDLSKNRPDVTYRQDVYSRALDGRLLPKHPLMASLFGAPFYGMLGMPGIWLAEQLVLVGVLASVYALASRLSAPPAADVVGVMAVLGTNLVWYYAYTFSYDLMGAGLVLAGVVVLPRRPLVAGLLWGLSLHFRVTHVILFPILLWGYLPAFRTNWKAWVWCGVGGAVMVVPLLWQNFMLFGDAVMGAYARVPTYRAGVELLDGNSMHFSWTYYREFAARLWGGRESVFHTYPVMVLLPLALWGVVCARKNQRQALALLGAGSASVVLHLGYSYWFGSGGDRFVLVAVLLFLPVWSLALEALLKSRKAREQENVQTTV
ncbi:MAG: hypothetical protein SFU85_04085 [Candidatus Methylacidiphilales bacterium]|nr:hypothetical protein [Candidatus Methylacidiphilales bacterium]